MGNHSGTNSATANNTNRRGTLPKAFLRSVLKKTMELGGASAATVRATKVACSAPQLSMAPNWCGLKTSATWCFLRSRRTPVASLYGASNRVIGLTPSESGLPRAFTCPLIQISATEGGIRPLAQFSHQSVRIWTPSGICNRVDRCELRDLDSPGCAAALIDESRLETILTGIEMYCLDAVSLTSRMVAR